MSENQASYIQFKINQLISITGFDIKQKDAKERLKFLVKPNLKQWVGEAILAGC